MYSFQEQIDMIVIYRECQESSYRAKQLYAQRYPNRSQPARATFKNVYDKLRLTGSLHTAKSDRKKRSTNDENEIMVLATVHQNPNISVRQIERECGVNRSSVLRILHRHKFHPYHLCLHQALHGQDFVNRVRFCEWIQHQMCNDNSFIDNILFTDEASFTNHGNVNLHNMHFWAVQNPHWMRQVEYQIQWSLNVWCGIIGNKIIGPYFIDAHLNGKKYTDFLVQKLGSLLEELPLATRLKMWYQHDGCPAHFSLLARRALNEKFPNRWIGRGSHITWPPRSPDLTPLDFFLWGTLKDLVYKDAPTTLQDMKERITEACAQITSETIKNATSSIIERMRYCLDNNGQQFEHLL